MTKAKELGSAYLKSTEEFFSGKIEEGEYNVQVRAIYREVLDWKAKFRGKKIKKVPKQVLKAHAKLNTLDGYGSN